MSVYAYDAVRTTKRAAQNIIAELQKTDYAESWLGKDLECMTKTDDGSIIFEWETWHGSPWEYIPIPEKDPLLWLSVNNDLEYAMEAYNDVPQAWYKDYEVIGEEGSQAINWIHYYEPVSIEELMKEQEE